MKRVLGGVAMALLAAPAAAGAAMWNSVDPVLLSPGSWNPVETEQQFTEADLDGDGLWSQQEAATMAGDVWWTSERFRHADQDGNGRLTLAEVEAQRDWESRHPDEFRRQLEEAIRQEMIVRFGPDAPLDLDDIDTRYLEAHPEVAEWMADHVRASRFLYYHTPARQYLMSQKELRDHIRDLQVTWEQANPAERAQLIETPPLAHGVSSQRAEIRQHDVLRSNEIVSGRLPEVQEPGAMVP